MKTSEIWFRLAVGKSRIVSASELKPLCQKIERPYNQVVNYLQRNGYIVRIIRGFFYVKSPEEVKLKVLHEDTLHLIADTLKKKSIKNWYFGLESALKLNNMTHEYFAVGFIITGSYSTPRPVKVVDGKYKFLRWSGKRSLHDFGIVDENGLRYSDPEKTLLDLCYREYYSKRSEDSVIGVYTEYQSEVNAGTIRKYLKHYPHEMSSMLEEVL